MRDERNKGNEIINREIEFDFFQLRELMFRRQY